MTTKDAAPALSSLRVAKTYSPERDGAKRFARRYGEQLVCVRHRLDATGTMRHTTVKLLVESTPVVSRSRAVVALRIPPTDKATRVVLLAAGAQWQPKAVEVPAVLITKDTVEAFLKEHPEAAQ